MSFEPLFKQFVHFDGTDNQDLYLQQMKEKCSSVDLTMYCIDVNRTRFVKGKDNPDVLAMQKLTRKFGNDFWKNAVIVLTFANMLEHLNCEWSKDKEEKSRAFKGVISEWEEQIKEILINDAGVPKEIVDGIKIVPAGHYLGRALQIVSTGSQLSGLNALMPFRPLRVEQLSSRSIKAG